ncbi:MAG: acyl-CoA thioesterase [Thermoanaerobaculia bacterium]
MTPPESNPTTAAVTVEVRYAETDQMGVVHHSVYPVWFELARTEFCRQTGYPYDRIEASGYHLLVTRLSVDYRRSARYPDRVTTECWIERLAGRGLRFSYRVAANGSQLARGTTDHVWIDAASGKPCRMPEHLSGPFAELAGTRAGPLSR